MCRNIVVFGIPSSEDRLRSDFCGDRSTDASTPAHVFCRLTGLGLSLIHPNKNSFFSQRSIVILGGAFLWNRLVKSCRTSSMVLPVCGRS